MLSRMRGELWLDEPLATLGLWPKGASSNPSGKDNFLKQRLFRVEKFLF